MKNIKFILVLLLSISIWSCEDDDDADINIMPSETVEGIAVLNTPEVLDFEITETTETFVGNEEEVATTFSWSPVTSNYNGTILYFLEMDIQGNNFKNAAYIPLDSGGSTETSLDITNGDLNLAVNQINTYLVTSGSALAVNFSVATEFEVRVISKADVSGDKTYSEPISIYVNAYEEIVVIEPELFLVGSIQSYYGVSSWTPEQALEMRYIGDGTTKVFEAYVKGTSGDIFKFISNQVGWDDIVGNYGVIDGAQDGNLMDGSDSGNIEIPEEGQYYVQVDLDNLTYKLVKMQWGVIGSATPNAWDGETAMTYDFNSNSWTIDIALTDGEIKFRSKNIGDEVYGDEWAFNVGVSDPMVTYNPAASNFAVSAGNATLTLKINVNGTAEVSGV
ncbi:SusE domain-containing protein [Lutibacter sp. B1]|uniref:SusE domain-containing protein n=1 Tax=Lutibacter sp. B1 TaxID=2725996 RepID=UPI001456D101|nr:SusE domain-containing protein [Lutibacter sp. B1]NLP56833.1 hypothetical protein [Lutibacter sp. B1]